MARADDRAVDRSAPPASMTPMRTRGKKRFYLLIFVLLAQPARGVCDSLEGPSDDYGPEVSAFLSLTKDEEEELEFQIQRGEISRKDYIRSKRRISVHRQTVLEIVRKSGEDVVPELHVVAAPEVDQLIENGTRSLKGAKPGAILNEKWKLISIVTRGELFYIFERISK